MIMGMEVGLSLDDFVLDGDPVPPPLKRHSPQFSPNVRCGQVAGWTKMPLGMEVGLGSGDFVFDGDPATPRKREHRPPPNFWPMSNIYCGQAAGWMKTPLGTVVDFGQATLY